jgi:hypothetical protein
LLRKPNKNQLLLAACARRHSVFLPLFTSSLRHMCPPLAKGASSKRISHSMRSQPIIVQEDSTSLIRCNWEMGMASFPYFEVFSLPMM